MPLHPPSPAARRRAAQAGFSASELLVVVAIIGMMVLITTPAMLNFWNSMKVRTAAHKLMSHARLCRQTAVARRTPVMLKLQRTNGSTQPHYLAWEERSQSETAATLVRNPAGADGSVNTTDDERWVVRDEVGMGVEKVTFVDSYDDTTPDDPADALSGSIMDGGGLMYLMFYPNGQVQRIDPTNFEPEDGDTQIRMRLERKITGTRKDVWDVTLNRVGKVGSDYRRVTP